MAQSSERSVTRAAGKSAANGAANGAAKSAAPPGSTVTANGMSSILGSLGVWRDRLNTFLAPRPSTSAASAGRSAGQTAGKTGPGAAVTPQRPSTGKVMLGMLAFVAGAELLLFLVQWIDVRFFSAYLEKNTVASHGTPILGGMTWFLLILMLLTLGLWITLNRFGIIQPLTPRPQAQAAAARNRSASATTTTAEGRNRAARRQATEARTGSGGKSVALSASDSARRASGVNDATYQRVKAAQRSRKRRAAKR